MIYKPSSAYYCTFITTNPSTGAAQNADSLPVATATRNGVDDGAFSLTVTNMDTGRYKITGTIPAEYAAGDRVQISISATVNGISGKAVLDNFQIDTKYESDTYTDMAKDATVAKEATLNTKASQASVDAVKAKTDNLPNDPADQSAVEAAIATAQSAIVSEVNENEVKLNTVIGYIDTEITSIINALNALQADLGDPSVDTTTIYAQILAVKAYVDELETRLTVARAGNLDNLDTPVSSRLASASYTAPDNAGIAAIREKTDQLNFINTDVKATLDGETVTVSSVMDKTGYALSATSEDNIVAKVWSHTTRTLTSFGSLVTDIVTEVWSATTRTLTGFGTLVADIWSYVTRTLTNGGTTAGEIWSYPTRTLTSRSVGANDDIASEQTLTNTTYGLQALKALIEAIDTSAELQARFEEIKGVGWTTETLKAIKEAVGIGTIVNLTPPTSVVITGESTSLVVRSVFAPNLKCTLTPEGDLNLVGKQGTTWKLEVSVKKADGSPFDLTGYTGRGMIRRTYTGPKTLDWTFALSPTPTDGKFYISLTAQQTATFRCGASPTDDISTYIYDVEIESALGEVTRILEGKLYVDPEVTKQ